MLTKCNQIFLTYLVQIELAFSICLTVNLRRDTNAISKSDNSYSISTLKPTAVVIYVRT